MSDSKVVFGTEVATEITVNKFNDLDIKFQQRLTNTPLEEGSFIYLNWIKAKDKSATMIKNQAKKAVKEVSEIEKQYMEIMFSINDETNVVVSPWETLMALWVVESNDADATKVSFHDKYLAIDTKDSDDADTKLTYKKDKLKVVKCTARVTEAGNPVYQYREFKGTHKVMLNDMSVDELCDFIAKDSGDEAVKMRTNCQKFVYDFTLVVNND